MHRQLPPWTIVTLEGISSQSLGCGTDKPNV